LPRGYVHVWGGRKTGGVVRVGLAGCGGVVGWFSVVSGDGLWLGGARVGAGRIVAWWGERGSARARRRNGWFRAACWRRW